MLYLHIVISAKSANNSHSAKPCDWLAVVLVLVEVNMSVNEFHRIHIISSRIIQFSQTTLHRIATSTRKNNNSFHITSNPSNNTFNPFFPAAPACFARNMMVACGEILMFYKQLMCKKSIVYNLKIAMHLPIRFQKYRYKTLHNPTSTLNAGIHNAYFKLKQVRKEEPGR